MLLECQKYSNRMMMLQICMCTSSINKHSILALDTAIYLQEYTWQQSEVKQRLRIKITHSNWSIAEPTLSNIHISTTHPISHSAGLHTRKEPFFHQQISRNSNSTDTISILHHFSLQSNHGHGNSSLPLHPNSFLPK